MDCRVIPSYNLDEIIKEVEDIAYKMSHKLSVEIDIEPVYRLDAPESTSINAPVVKALSKAIEQV